MKALLIAASAMAIFSASVAQAQDADWNSFFYVKAGAGWSQTEDQTINDPGNIADIDMNHGGVFSGAIGTRLGMFRPEIELSYRSNGIDGIDVNGAPVAPVDGDMVTTALMANLFLDIPTGLVIQPYIGAGIGYAHVEVDDYAVNTITFVDDSDNVFAWQAVVGAEYFVDPEWSVFGEYKYFDTSDVDVSTINGTNNSIDTQNHSIMAGVKINFP